MVPTPLQRGHQGPGLEPPFIDRKREGHTRSRFNGDRPFSDKTGRYSQYFISQLQPIDGRNEHMSDDPA